MSEIDILYPSPMDLAGKRIAVERIAARLADEFGVESQWQDDLLLLQHGGVEGRILLQPDHVRVQARLGFLLAPMRGPIEAKIRQLLAERLGTPC
ncbi:polyhydroxyalkanoic acid system family protein [Luteimonas sp. e5]